MKFRPHTSRLAPALAGLLALGLSTAALADPHGEHRGDGRGSDSGMRGGEGVGRGPPERYERRGGPGDGDRGWDERRYNGYYIGPRWYAGPPPPFVFSDPNYRPGFTPWRRGDFLPQGYQGYVVEDYDRYHLRRPPYGYVWIQAGDELVLVSQSTGQIFEVVTGF